MARPLFDSVKDWTPDRLPSLAGRTYFITGGNSGIGLEAAKMLAKKEANVIIASRSPEKGKYAAGEIESLGDGETHVVQLDLADLTSVEACAKAVEDITPRLDGMINNAGIMQTPKRQTKDGFELQIGTNHFGHFRLNQLVFDLVKAAEGRVVVVSSIAHKYGRINFDNLMFERGYDPTSAYTQSKLANLLYALELDRRLEAADSKVTAYACHPGYSNTNLQSTGPEGFFNVLYKFLNPLMAQPAHKGAIPTVLCAAGIEARPGGYYGPTGWFDASGPVGDAGVAEQARDEETARRLWEETEKRLGITFDVS